MHEAYFPRVTRKQPCEAQQQQQQRFFKILSYRLCPFCMLFRWLAFPPGSSDLNHYRTLVERGVGAMLEDLNLTPPRICPTAVELVKAMLVIDRDARPCSAEALAGLPFCRERPL